MKQQSNGISLAIYDHTMTQVHVASLIDFAPDGEELAGKLHIKLDGKQLDIAVRGKTVQIPAGGVSMLNGNEGHLSVSISLVMAPYMPGFTGGIMIGNGVIANTFSFIGTPDGLDPARFGDNPNPDQIAHMLAQMPQT
ncbi:hypothetical protein SAMN02745857_01246 [Andreprevotia lacus DSM 23236]|jgi:hypothetical protein|uniref:Uncharacterized protein n=1 Tax=Andreprevotia lacus DSM 23236 TaxID=1121001 RepID=A0A1W1XCP0_9NEIS|nr:hypothetical protein [Andreprevotia lacus]SMC21805.1 hypothetical protein SAMN02745857_01246 [Andreprevotia lacus DSM 23236]